MYTTHSGSPLPHSVHCSCYATSYNVFEYSFVCLSYVYYFCFYINTDFEIDFRNIPPQPVF